MVILRLFALLGALVLAGCVSSPTYVGREATTTGTVNMRAGPGVNYPQVAVLPAGAIVTVYGCVEGYTWCDTARGSSRGWVSSRYLSVFYANQTYTAYPPVYPLPVIAFDFGYWDTWYTGYPWYRYPRWGYYPGWNGGYRGGFYRNDDLVFRGGGGFPGGGRGGRND